MRWIVEWSLKYRFFVVAFAVATIFTGVIQVRNTPADALPEFAPPYVEVQTEAPGLSTPEVEELVTLNLEELLNGTPWLQTIRSTSVPGLSSIVLYFQPGTDIIRARQLVAERLSLAYTLPNVAKPPVILQPQSAMSRVMMVGLSSKQISLLQMSILARWNIRPALLSVPGVANVSIWGMRDRQLQVQVDPQKLQAQHITLDQIVSTTGNALWVSPLSFLNASSPGSGGWVDTPEQRLEVRHVLPISSPADLAQVNVEGTNLRLGDVTTVVEDHQPLIGDDVSTGDPALLLVIEKFPGANTLDVTRGIEAKLAELQPGLSGIQIDSNIFRPATFVELALENLARSLLVGLLLMVLVLLVFFTSWRMALISIVSILVSLLTAGLVLSLRGVTVNAMALAGLIIAIGVVVDDAITSVEHYARRLREAQQAQNRAEINTLLQAALQARSPLIYATLVLLLTALPLVFLGGIAGNFFQPLALSYILALLASLLVALTLTPALCLLLLRNALLQKRESPVTRWLQGGYDALLGRMVRGRRTGLLASIVIALAIIASVGLAFLPTQGVSMLPSFKEPDVVIQWEGPPGTSSIEMTRITTRASAELRALPGVSNVGAHIGRAELGDQVVDVNSGEMWVTIDPTANYGTTLAAIRNVVNGYPGIFHEVQTYLDEQTRQVVTGSSQDIVVRIFGPDLGVLRSKAEEVRQAITLISGTADVHTEFQVDQPEIQIKVNLAKSQQYGLTPGDVRRTAATLVAGLEAGSLFEQQKVFQVVVVGTPETRRSLTSIENILIDTPNGGHVRLGEVADVSIAATANLVRHETVSRRIDVSLNVRGRDPNAVVNDINALLQRVKFPLEYHASVLGVYQGQQEAQLRVLAIGFATLLAIFLLFQAAFGSWRLAFLALFTLPSALTGGVLVAFTIEGLSLGALLGLLVVIGLAARACVLLFKHYQYLERVEGIPFGPDLVLHGARERFPATLITTLLTAVVLAPLVFFGNIPGQEIASPMAIVILGGLVTSTILTLFIMPLLYARFGAGTRDPAGSMLKGDLQPEQPPLAAPSGKPGLQTLSRTRLGNRRARPGYRMVLAVFLLASLCLSACAQAASTDSGRSDQAPATVEHIDGTNLNRVTLTAQAAQRLGIETAPVSEVQIHKASRLAVPYSALLYDLNGKTWVYTQTGSLTFERAAVAVDTINGDQVLLLTGPPVGTRVVTVGVAELYGTEFKGGLEP